MSKNAQKKNDVPLARESAPGSSPRGELPSLDALRDSDDLDPRGQGGAEDRLDRIYGQALSSRPGLIRPLPTSSVEADDDDYTGELASPRPAS